MTMNGNIDETATFETFKTFFSTTNYEKLYSLPPADFFKQVMIRDRYFNAPFYFYSPNKPTFLKLIEIMLTGEVILDENILKKYAPNKIKISPPVFPKGIQTLSLRRSIIIASDLLGLVDKGSLTLKEVPKEDSTHDYYSSMKHAMEHNILNKEFSGQSYQDVINERDYENHKDITDIILEVDLNTPEGELVQKFKEIIRAQKKLYEDKTHKGNVKNLIEKCNKYKVLEAYDITQLSKLLKVKITQKKLASIIFYEWRGEKSDDDYRKTTLKYINKIFDHFYYIQHLK